MTSQDQQTFHVRTAKTDQPGCLPQGLSLRVIWAKYSPLGPKFSPLLLSGRTESLSCQHTIDEL